MTKFIDCYTPTATNRVILREIDPEHYEIEEQEYAPDWPLQWEVQDDGWRTTVMTGASAIQEAYRKFVIFADNLKRWIGTLEGGVA